MTNILSIEEVRKAIWKDEDFDSDESQRLSQVASSFIKEKTGYDFGQDIPVHPLAKQCAVLYVRQQYFGSDGYNEKYDFTMGITSLLVDLQGVADDYVTAAGAEEAAA